MNDAQDPAAPAVPNGMGQEAGADRPPAESGAPSRNYTRPVEVITIATVVGLDQLTKEIVRRTIELYDRVPVIDGLLDITHVQNTGAAFGLLNAADFPYKPAVMIAIASIALVAIAASRGLDSRSSSAARSAT